VTFSLNDVLIMIDIVTGWTNQDGKLLTRSQYVSTIARNYETLFSPTMDLQTEDVTSSANERYDQLQAEQSQRAANVVADFVQPDHATGEQPTVADKQRQWMFTQVIYKLLFKSCRIAPQCLRKTESQQSTRRLFYIIVLITLVHLQICPL
jgi:hypothetical protein